jgi:transcriptional regulator
MAKKKAPAKRPAKTSEKTKKLATPKSNVKILERAKSQGLTPKARANANKIMNKANTEITNKAKSGETAKKLAGYVKESNNRKPRNVIKIRSGGAGLGGMFGVKNR